MSLAMEAMDPGRRRAYLFAGGGTGGHLYPAVAIAQKLLEKEPEAEIHFVGTTKGLESKVIPSMGYPLHLIAVRGFARRLALANVLVPFRLLWSLAQCMKILHEIKPVAVVGTGGYVSGPMLMIAAISGYPTLVQEQNSYPGVTTRLLAKWVDQVHLSFQDSTVFFKKKEKLIVSGNPVRDLRLFIPKAEARRHYDLQPDKPTLLVFGGSQGARGVNRAMVAALESLMNDTDVQIIWSTGTIGLKEVKASAEKFSSRVWTSEYIADMENAYRASDLAVCRSGAMTLAEITLAGLPAILIPLPSAAANHQAINARALAKMGAAVMLSEDELGGETLAIQIKQLLADPARRTEIGKAAQAAAFPDAADNIVRSIFDLVNVIK
jgi:UDP-N-acetylglucosamine--N-acetylmuramyl-(pentapeptide) pyrophosphoryl-undecaprenol N-acetylglucosamine transferase